MEIARALNSSISCIDKLSSPSTYLCFNCQRLLIKRDSLERQLMQCTLNVHAKLIAICQQQSRTSVDLSENSLAARVCSSQDPISISTAILESTSTANNQESTSTLESRESASTVISQELTPTVSHQDSASTLESWESASTIITQESTSTVSSQKSTSTLESQELASTVISQESTFTVSSQKSISTLENQESASTVINQESTSAVNHHDSTSTLESRESASTIIGQESTFAVNNQELMPAVISQSSRKRKSSDADLDATTMKKYASSPTLIVRKSLVMKLIVKSYVFLRLNQLVIQAQGSQKSHHREKRLFLLFLNVITSLLQLD